MLALLRLFNIKARNEWTDKKFTNLLELLHEMLLKGNTLSTSHYEAKKILDVMGMEYQKIHACPNDCILYRKEFEPLYMCPRRWVSGYRVKDDDSDEDDIKKGPLTKVLCYLPITPRCKHFFTNVNDTNNLTCHANGRKFNGLLQHVVGLLKCKKIDCLYLEFGINPRNPRLGLATNEMNLCSNFSNEYSSWPILVITLICLIGCVGRENI